MAADHVAAWTVEDVLVLPEYLRYARHELLDGTLLVTPAPSHVHQRATGRLYRLLEEAIEAGSADVEVIQGISVEISSGFLIPDICVVAESPLRIELDPAELIDDQERPAPTGASPAWPWCSSPSAHPDARRIVSRFFKPSATT